VFPILLLVYEIHRVGKWIFDYGINFANVLDQYARRVDTSRELIHMVRAVGSSGKLDLGGDNRRQLPVLIKDDLYGTARSQWLHIKLSDLEIH
jgi:hypothetical protein